VLYARFFRGPVLGPDSCNQNAGETSTTARAHNDVVLRFPDGKLTDIPPSGDEIDEKRSKEQEKELKEKQKIHQKTSKTTFRKRKEKAEEAQGVQEKKKKRRKQEADASEDSPRQKKRKREKTAKVQIVLESDDEKGVLPERSEDRLKKQKRRKKSKDEDSIE
jgi:nucleolar protein TMA23